MTWHTSMFGWINQSGVGDSVLAGPTLTQKYPVWEWVTDGVGRKLLTITTLSNTSWAAAAGRAMSCYHDTKTWVRGAGQSAAECCSAGTCSSVAAASCCSSDYFSCRGPVITIAPLKSCCKHFYASWSIWIHLFPIHWNWYLLYWLLRSLLISL